MVNTEYFLMFSDGLEITGFVGVFVCIMVSIVGLGFGLSEKVTSATIVGVIALIFLVLSILLIHSRIELREDYREQLIQSIEDKGYSNVDLDSVNKDFIASRDGDYVRCSLLEHSESTYQILCDK